jgi:glucosamine 6-phosphate synthetase-like amidotransferase/phosphosugar isomerase protein
LKKFRRNIKLGKRFNKQVVGICNAVLTKKTNEIVAARLGSPLAIGMVKGSILSLDASPLLNTLQMPSI